jgi:hypothetical protein
MHEARIVSPVAQQALVADPRFPQRKRRSAQKYNPELVEQSL